MIAHQFLRVVVVTMCLMAFVFTPIWSQEPEAEPVNEWRGKLVIDGGRPELVTFNVRRDNGTYKILSMKYLKKDFPVKEFSWAQDTISFTWKPGEFDTHCELRKQEETGYVGNCKFSDSDTFLGLTIVPPVKQAGIEEPVE